MSDTVDYCKTCFHTRDIHIEDGPCDEANCSCLEFVFGETRTTSSTGAQKGVKAARYDLIPIPALDFLARLYGKGAEKYSEHNWRKGYEWSKSYAAAQRHMNAFWAGEDIDPETQVPHVINAAFHMFALATFLTEHPEMDDRYESVQDLRDFVSTIDLESNSSQFIFEGDIVSSGPLVAPDEPVKIVKEDRLEAIAQALSREPNGKTITFGREFSDEDIAHIFTRAKEISDSLPASWPFEQKNDTVESGDTFVENDVLTSTEVRDLIGSPEKKVVVPEPPSYNSDTKTITIPEVEGMCYYDHFLYRIASGDHKIDERTTIKARPKPGYTIPYNIDSSWVFDV